MGETPRMPVGDAVDEYVLELDELRQSVKTTKMRTTVTRTRTIKPAAEMN